MLAKSVPTPVTILILESHLRQASDWELSVPRSDRLNGQRFALDVLLDSGIFLYNR